MVITKVIGGLGNQMFQYAAGRALAYRLGTPLKLDVSGFEFYLENKNVDFRHYHLSHLNIVEDIATEEDLSHFKDKLTKKSSRIKNFFIKIIGNKDYMVYKEKYFHYDKKFSRLDGNIYISGYWNSENYFMSIKDIIKTEFSYKSRPDIKNRYVLDKINSLNSIGVHIRRGDYISNYKANRLHGVCDISYYQHCIKHISEKVSNPHFFIFSDDIDWARENLSLPFPMTIVDYNGPLDGHEDMRLMSHCKHQIIANSTFSWWAAWLNSNPDKIILAPKQWFRLEKYNIKDLLPEGWITL